MKIFILKNGWDVYCEGLLRIYTYPRDKEFDVLLIAKMMQDESRIN